MIYDRISNFKCYAHYLSTTTSTTKSTYYVYLPLSDKVGPTERPTRVVFVLDQNIPLYPLIARLMLKSRSSDI